MWNYLALLFCSYHRSHDAAQRICCKSHLAIHKHTQNTPSCHLVALLLFHLLSSSVSAFCLFYFFFFFVFSRFYLKLVILPFQLPDCETSFTCYHFYINKLAAFCNHNLFLCLVFFVFAIRVGIMKALCLWWMCIVYAPIGMRPSSCNNSHLTKFREKVDCVG